MLSTIIVSPRERFSSLPESLQSLFLTIPKDQPVIVVEGATPPDIRVELEDLQKRRPFTLVSLPYPVTPNEARNRGVKLAKTAYVVFCDNDIAYEAGWLRALEKTAVAEQADAVAPLIFIGPSTPKRIHHAGGSLIAEKNTSSVILKEKHRLMNQDWPEVKDRIDELAPVANEVCEFHCAMVKRSFLQAVGGLDERLITREQMDFALQAKARNGRVVFSRAAHVTYRAFDPITRLDDLHYFLFRWSDEKVVQSLNAFEKNWSVSSERDRVRFGWTRRHRRSAVASYHKKISKVLGSKLTGRILLPMEELRAKSRFRTSLTQHEAAPRTEPRTTIVAEELFDFKVQGAAS
ncbi:MAG: glycosyltransferase [Rhodobacteraceae bacterium]|nr:glycosyltransferase [Paracoccaceae bacterium]